VEGCPSGHTREGDWGGWCQPGIGTGSMGRGVGQIRKGVTPQRSPGHFLPGRCLTWCRIDLTWNSGLNLILPPGPLTLLVAGHTEAKARIKPGSPYLRRPQSPRRGRLCNSGLRPSSSVLCPEGSSAFCLQAFGHNRDYMHCRVFQRTVKSVLQSWILPPESNGIYPADSVTTMLWGRRIVSESWQQPPSAMSFPS
jgi:hypothetical protein